MLQWKQKKKKSYNVNILFMAVIFICCLFQDMDNYGSLQLPMLYNSVYPLITTAFYLNKLVRQSIWCFPLSSSLQCPVSGKFSKCSFHIISLKKFQLYDLKHKYLIFFSIIATSERKKKKAKKTNIIMHVFSITKTEQFPPSPISGDFLSSLHEDN